MVEVENSQILYVEDNDDDFEILNIVFQKLKHLGSLIRANDTNSAKAYLNEAAASGKLPELILVDLNLGEEKGTELIQFIRSQQDFRPIPVIAVSGCYVFKDLDESFQTGANLFLIKPTDLRGWTDLVMRLQEYFAQK